MTAPVKQWRVVLITRPRGNGTVVFIKAPTAEAAEAEARRQVPDATEAHVTPDTRDPGGSS